MTMALQKVNLPEEIEAIYNEIPMDDMILENCSNCGYRYYLKSLADVELRNYTEVIETLTPITNTIEDNYLKRPLISAFVKSGKYVELQEYLSDYALNSSSQDIDYLRGFAGVQLINSNQSERANQYFDKIISRKTPALNTSDLAQIYYFKKDYINAQKQYKSLYDSNKNDIDIIVRLAISYFKNGSSEKAKTYIEKLNNLNTDYRFGAVDYGWAQYYATLGEKDVALKSLLKAVAQGYNYTPLTFQNDPHFKTIKESPEFINRIMNYWKNKTQ